jgi:hypothetical protein
MQYNSDERIDTYHAWQQAQKIPINRGFFIEDLRKLEVAPWNYKGGMGAFINLEGTGTARSRPASGILEVCSRFL